MSMPSSTARPRPLVSLAVYCPLLCQDKEDKAQDNILFYFPSRVHPNKQMNHVGFCIAMSSLAPRFGIPRSHRQTIRKQRSSVCLFSPVADLWISAHVRGGYGEAETTHQLLQLSLALFEFLYSRAALLALTRLPTSAAAAAGAEAASLEEEEASKMAKSAMTLDGRPASMSLPRSDDATIDARAALQSFFSKCSAFIADVLAAQQRALTNGAAAVPISLEPSPVLSQAGWAQYLRAEASFGFPLHFADARAEALPRSSHSVEDVVHQVLWARAWGRVNGAVHQPDALPRCCVFRLPSLFIQMADSRLSTPVLKAIKYYLLLYSPITSSSFCGHLPGEGACEVAVWREGTVVVVLLEPLHRTPTPHVAKEDAPASPVLTSSSSSSLLECASAVAAEVLQSVLRPLYGLSTPVERETCWLAAAGTSHSVTSRTTLARLSAAAAASPNTLVLHARFVGSGVVEGTALFALWPGLMEHLRTMIHTTRLNLAATTPSADATWACWTRWASVWIFLRFVGATVHVLAWRSPVNFRQLATDAQRLLLISS